RSERIRREETRRSALLPLLTDPFVAFDRRDQDQDRVEPREVDRRLRFDFLIFAELALDHFRDARDRNSGGEPLSFAARDEEIADLDFVARIDHFDLAPVP